MDGDPMEFNTADVGMHVPDEPTREPKQQQNKSYRLIMSAGLFDALGKDMQKKVATHGRKSLYVIEYDVRTQELFTDVADKGEEINAV
jgi:hypothetical protein